MFRVQKQNTVFRHDADDHDHAHSRSNVERRPCDEQRQEPAERGKQRGPQNRCRCGKSPEFKQQHRKQKQQCQQQNHQQVA